MLSNEESLKRQSCFSADSYAPGTSLPVTLEVTAETKSLKGCDFHSTRSRSGGCLLLGRLLTCFGPVLLYASPALSFPPLAIPPTSLLSGQSFSSVLPHRSFFQNKKTEQKKTQKPRESLRNHGALDRS